MPLSSRVAVPEGGKFAGMRMMVVLMPRAASGSQNGWPCRSDWTLPLDNGNCHRPNPSVRPAGAVAVVDKYGCIVLGSRCTKSKMPCPPGSSPVMKVDQATGLCGGMVVASDEKPPLAARRARPGKRPAAIIWPVKS